jgi:hypothetical protein
MRGKVIAGVLVLGLLGGQAQIPAAVGAESALGLHPDVFAAFETYRQARRPGAFAVSEDGMRFGQSLCREPRCDFAAEKRNALQACREQAEKACVVFATGDDIKLAYRLLTRAELSACPLTPAPTISVTVSVEDAAFDRTQDVADLNRLMFDDERHWIDEEGAAMGVTQHLFDLDWQNVQSIETEGRDGARCVGYKDGEIAVTLGATIFVASEIPGDSCLYREVLAHEQRHRALGSEMTIAFGRQLEAEIAAALRQQPYVEVPSGDMPWLVADQHLQAIIDAAYAVFRRDHSRRQLAIDSNEEYRRVEAVCPGETDKYIP